MAEQFHYTYSATEQEEVNKIREKYVAKEESKMDRLRRLDKKAETPGRNIAITLGVMGALIAGTGMSIVMELANSREMFVAGIIIGIVGFLVAGLAYPVNRMVTKRERAKIAAQVIALADEIA